MGKRVCLTYGVFDLPHYGHIRAIKQARKGCEFLILGIFTDKVAASFKRMPILSQRERYLMMKEIGLADKVVYMKSIMPSEKFLRNNRVSIVCKAEGAGWNKNNIPTFKNTISYLLPYTKGISTSEIINRIKCLS